MAGPCTSILLKEPISPENKELVRRDISTLANNVEGDNFWVQGLPFLLSFGSEYKEGQLQAYRESGLFMKLGWTPRDMITFCAGCNDGNSHRILGEFCLRFVRQLDGIIDFDGLLFPLDGSRLSSDLYQQYHAEEHLESFSIDEIEQGYQQLLAGFPGKKFIYRYQIGDDENFSGLALCGDDVFMEAWLHNPYFHMVK